MQEKALLIIDDSKLARMMIAKIVATHRPELAIIEAHGAEDAVTQSQGQSIDLITLDMNMPGQDGLAFAPELRLLHPQAKIALLTANIQPRVQIQAKELGLFFIPKPINPKKLISFFTWAASTQTGG